MKWFCCLSVLSLFIGNISDFVVLYIMRLHTVFYLKKKKKLPELLSDFLSGSICSVQLDVVSVHCHPKYTRHIFSMGQSGRPSGTILKHAMMCVLDCACETTGMLGQKKKMQMCLVGNIEVNLFKISIINRNPVITVI